MNLDDELNNTILSFTDIQAELNLQDAQDAMREIVEHLDLTPEERAGLEPEIEGLETMRDKLEQTRIQIAVFGMVGRGKSSILNALLGQNIFETGPIHGVTQATQAQSWQLSETSPQASDLGNDVVSYRISQVELIDTPGIDEVDGKTREEIARQVAQQADLLLFVIAGDITQVE
ncbi:MAG: GTPase, partial [Cyanobacteriota bacterium]|nr:GTPase [Cyanobacteriota bacterium]